MVIFFPTIPGDGHENVKNSNAPGTFVLYSHLVFSVVEAAVAVVEALPTLTSIDLK